MASMCQAQLSKTTSSTSDREPLLWVSVPVEHRHPVHGYVDPVRDACNELDGVLVAPHGSTDEGLAVSIGTFRGFRAVPRHTP